ncbi:DMT family transporter [Pseudomonas alloputida]|uniref:DMT family transporter n=1 Tax=Pseudomonas TaxID=286 RepID=UPI003EEC13E5
MAIRKPVDGMAAGLMVLLCLTWGAQQVAIKVVAHDVPPMAQIALRSGVAAILVLVAGKLWSREPWLPGVWHRAGLAVGLLFAAEFLFIAQGLRYTSASHMAVFLYTAPLFVAMGLHFRLPEERLNHWQWTGMAVAFAGIAITFLAPREGASAVDAMNSLSGDVMGLCAGAALGFTTVAVRVSKLSEAPATQTLFYQLAGACLVLLPVACASGQIDSDFTPAVWLSLAFQTVAVSFASYLIWFWMLRRYLAARLGVMSFMTPLFGVLMGAFWLDEEMSPGFAFGAILALAGILIVSLSKGRAGHLSPPACGRTIKEKPQP